MSKKEDKKVAIFDVDGTVFRSSLLIELVEALVDATLMPPEARNEYEKEYTAWRNRKGSYEDYINAVVKSFYKNIKGVYYGDVADIAKSVIDEQRDHIYRYSRDLIKDLKKEKYYLLAISQSPKTILDSFCVKLGFDKVYGSMYELGPEDRFTGKAIDIHLIKNKAGIVRRAIEKENLTLAGSVGIGDTEGDIPFLELVETPICFNPNAKLYRHAKRLGWKVVVERKDMIYELS